MGGKLLVAAVLFIVATDKHNNKIVRGELSFFFQSRVNTIQS